MNPAATSIIRLFLTLNGKTDGEIEEALGILKRGTDRGEQDSIGMVRQLVEKAKAVEFEPSYRDVIDEYYALHLQYEALDAQEKKVDTLIAIRTVIDNVQPTPLAERIAQAKIKAILETA